MATYRITTVGFEAPITTRKSVRVRVRLTSSADQPASYTVFDNYFLADPSTGSNGLFVNSSGDATPVDINIAPGVADTSYTVWITPECESNPGSKSSFVITGTGTGGVDLFAYRIGYFEEDPFINEETAPVNVVYPAAFSGSISSVNAAITLLKTANGFSQIADKYLVLETVVAITDRGHAINGTDYLIPLQEFSRVVVAAGKRYRFSNQPWGLITTENFVFTV